MSYALEFPGSELRDLAVAGDAIVLRLAAAAVRGADGTRGWLTGVRLAFAGASLAGDARQALGTIAEGRLRQDGRTIAALELPSTLAGELELALRLADGGALTLRAHRLEAGIGADGRFADDHSC